ncbi:hypothetical protein RF11_11309 [Thelohanellus kitauei]|uniref:Uncharacterized protein n=1 Tax=Thelohanellus kitauei TaxID=669202 RepID=A0A0C2MA73_THEKT|nr:hypothetical protein RF11_11309 [Thelohanellus kitauei]
MKLKKCLYHCNSKFSNVKTLIDTCLRICIQYLSIKVICFDLNYDNSCKENAKKVKLIAVKFRSYLAERKIYSTVTKVGRKLSAAYPHNRNVDVSLLKLAYQCSS